MLLIIFFMRVAKLKTMFWKIFFYITTILFSISFLMPPTDYTFVNFVIFNLLKLLILSSILLPLFGFSWKKKIFKKVFWKIIFIIHIFLSIIIFSSTLFISNSAEGIFLNFLPIIPIYFALYYYAFTNIVWSEKDKEAKENKKNNKLIFWKTYFWFIFIILAFSLIVEPFKQTIEIIDIINIPIQFAILVCLYGFIWQKKILNQIFWKVFFVSNIIFDIIILPSVSQKLKIEMGDKFNLGFIIFSVITLILISFPSYWANYLYAFKNKDIWRNNN